MMKNNSTNSRDSIYRSRWDKSTWLILVIVTACCIIPCFLDDGIGPVIVCIAMLCFVLLTFLGTYYKIHGNQLQVYTFFILNIYPIDKINEIKPTTSVISSPATSLTKRIAITFNDPKILKSTTPLILSPVHQEEFIQELLSINPTIKSTGLN